MSTLASEKDNADALEEALQLYDKALTLRPTAADIQQERNLISLYLDVLTYSDVDWSRAIAILETLYATDPQYRDVEQRLQDAHAAYAEQFVRGEQWCEAAAEYAGRGPGGERTNIGATARRCTGAVHHRRKRWDRRHHGYRRHDPGRNPDRACGC